MLDLELLAAVLGQGLVVGDLRDDRRDLLAERARELLARGLRVLDRVVEDGGEQSHAIAHAMRPQHRHHREWMVDVRRPLLVLAPLIAVLVRRELEARRAARPSRSSPVLSELGFHDVAGQRDTLVAQRHAAATEQLLDLRLELAAPRAGR